MGILTPRHEFASLSVRDLLDAREAYHLHLMHLENVVATAVGRYRFDRNHDRAGRSVSRRENRGRDEPRTLQNTQVTARSWPCILVFVSKWIKREDFGKKFDEIVPPRLYLPDGRVVPTCVLYTETLQGPRRPITHLRFPGSALGGGYPVLSDVQGTTHVGTLGCLVSDGRSLFALTDAHVAGEPNSPVYTLVQGERELIGSSHPKRITKMAFERAYPGFPGRRTIANLDVGLVRVEDAKRWTSQVYGIGQFGELADINPETASIDLIGCPVVSYGAASGRMEGEIVGLFYRYRSIGGVDYVADFLIGPRSAGGTKSRNGYAASLAASGNSGAIWFLEQPQDDGDDAHESGALAVPTPPVLRPFAIHWGGQTFSAPSLGAGTEVQAGLASSLGTVCRELEVDIVRDLNTGLPETWGKVGHYKIGQIACAYVTDPNLKKLLNANVGLISYTDEQIQDIGSALASQKFVGLADVPDIVWKGTEAKRGRESPNHFADMDERSPTFGKTLLEDCTSVSKLDPDRWNQFYESVDVEPNHRGLLPFRCWQLWDVMVSALSAGDCDRYVCAAGVLAHYVGDACQPLHTSRLHDGDPETGEGEGVHSAYETRMLDVKAPEIIELVNQEPAPPLKSIQSGRDAGFEVVKLMKACIGALPPQELISVYEENRGRGQVEALWQAFGPKTAKLMARGAGILASIWQGAWLVGNGAALPKSELKQRSKTTLRAIYRDRRFAASGYLTHMKLQDGELTVEIPE